MAPLYLADFFSHSKRKQKLDNVGMQKNILALDLGKGSLGIAISRSGLFVTPLTNLRFPATHYDEALIGLKKCIENEKVELIVIGYPLYPSGDPCEMTPIVEEFIEKLSSAFPGIPIVKQDERNSTVEASALLHESGKNSKRQKNNIDSVAATVILNRYLKEIGQD